MKTIIWKITAAVMMVMGLVSSCKDPITGEENTDGPETVLPAFPVKVVDNNVAPGAELTLTFKANLDWELSVPSETLQWYWIIDGSQKVAKVNDKAGDVVVKIGVSDVEEFDSARACVVSLKMGGKTEVVAEYSRAPKERELAVYACVLDVDGESFKLDGDANVVFAETEATEVNLIWPYGGGDFRTYIKVKANYAWTLNLPEWVEAEVPEERVGEVALLLKGVSSKYPKEGAKAQISFMAGETSLKTVDITIPACNNKLEYRLQGGMEEIVFNALGQYKNLTGYVDGAIETYVTSTSGARLVTAKWNGSNYEMNAEWVVLTADEWDNASYADVIQERKVAISVAENTGDERKALVFYLPESYKADLFDVKEGVFNQDATAVKDEFKANCFEVIQESASGEFIIPLSSAEAMATVGASFEVVENASFKTQFKAQYAYDLTYLNQYSRDEAHMVFSKSVASYKVFNAARVEQTAADFWLSFTFSDEKKGGVVDMTADEKITGYVAFYDAAGNTVAVIRCNLDPETNVGSDIKVEFIGDTAPYAEAMGATLVEVTSGKLYDQYKEYMCPIYHLTYTQKNMPFTISLPITAKSYSVNPYAKRHVFRVNDLNYDETVGEFERVDGGVQIYMGEKGSTSKYEEGNIMFYTGMNSGTVVLVLVCTYDIRNAQ